MGGARRNGSTSRRWSLISTSSRPWSCITWSRTRQSTTNLAESEPDVVAFLKARMDAWIARREQETGLPNPIHHQGAWWGGKGPFTSSQEAYDTMHIGDPAQAAKLQAGDKK